MGGVWGGQVKPSPLPVYGKGIEKGFDEAEYRETQSGLIGRPGKVASDIPEPFPMQKWPNREPLSWRVEPGKTGSSLADGDHDYRSITTETDTLRPKAGQL